MKTLFEKLIIQFESIAHPAGGWFKTTATQRKRKTGNLAPLSTLSPECYNIRGLAKKSGGTRSTPAP